MRCTWICLMLLGCGDTPPPLVETELVFEAETPEGESAVYVTGELGAELIVDVWLRSTDVFGVSAHVVHALEVGELLGDAPLGTDDRARHLVVEEPGDIALGGTLVTPELGEVDAREPLHLASLRFAPPTTSSDLRIDSVTVRRADGSFVPTRAFGASVVVREVE